MANTLPHVLQLQETKMHCILKNFFNCVKNCFIQILFYHEEEQIMVSENVNTNRIKYPSIITRILSTDEALLHKYLSQHQSRFTIGALFRSMIDSNL